MLDTNRWAGPVHREGEVLALSRCSFALLLELGAQLFVVVLVHERQELLLEVILGLGRQVPPQAIFQAHD